MHRRSVRALIFFFGFYVTFGVFLTITQECIVYQPGSQDFFDCPALADAELIEHAGTRMYVSTTTGPTMVLYHGNAGSACDRAFLAERFEAAGYGFVLVEYAGYSNDSTPPSHERIKQDVMNVIDFLATRNVSEVALVGESIGAGVASHHASLAPPERLLLIAPFPDLQAVAAERFWFYPTSWLVENAYAPERSLAKYNGPVTIIHGSDDRIIPQRLGWALFDTLKTEKTFVSIDGAGHNDLFLYPETFAALDTFLLD